MEQNYLKEMNLTNARLIDQINGQKKSMYRNNTQCRLYTSRENEMQENLKTC